MLRNAAVACLTSGMAIPHCSFLPSRRVETIPADFKIARCCERFAFEMPSPSCSSAAQRSPRVNISIRCSRVGFCEGLADDSLTFVDFVLTIGLTFRGHRLPQKQQRFEYPAPSCAPRRFPDGHTVK